MMKVAFTGPSGSGKTTLVRHIEYNHSLTWLNGSSGTIKTEEDNKWLSQRGLAVGQGHAAVIRTGHMNPDLAIENQKAIQTRRHELILRNTDFVTDRSPIDNWVYYLLQCAIYEKEPDTIQFLEKCRQATKELTHIIFIPTLIPIEDNNSRVANFWYQEAVSAVFRQAIDKFETFADVEGWKTKFLRINTTNLNLRKLEVDRFLNR